jgi:hypothetical protein
MTRILLVLVSAVAMGWGLVGLAPGVARAEATIESTDIRNDYPTGIVFALRASAPSEIVDVSLAFRVEGRGTSAVAKPEEFTAGTAVQTTVTIKTDPDTSDWLPIGNDITWHWELTLADGTTTVGPDSTFLFLPPEREWATAENEVARVYYYGDRAELAGRFLTAMEETYQLMGQELLKTDLPRKPVKLVLLGNNDELQGATPSKGSTLDNSERVVTCGVRPGNANDIIYGTLQCAGSDPVDTVRHEFGHILNAAAGESTLVKLPYWLDEGLAVFAQEDNSTYTSAFRAATRSSRGRGLIPFTQMNDATSDENLVILQYGQAFAMTAYLIDTYGVEKLNDLMAATKDDTRFDQALEAVYGFDMQGFEEEFSAAVGAAGETPTAAPTERPQSQPQPTSAPTQRPQTLSSDDGDDGGVSTGVVVIGGVVVILLLAAVFSFLLAMYLQNQRRPPAASG